MRLLTAVSLVRVQQGEFFNIWLLGQAVKTSPFHGGNTGSIPVGVINSQNAAVIVTDAFLVVKRFTE